MSGWQHLAPSEDDLLETVQLLCGRGGYEMPFATTIGDGVPFLIMP